MSIFQWFAYRRALREDRDYDRGYNYAAGKLLANRFRPEIMEQLENAIGWEGNDPFDRGIQAALRAWYLMEQTNATGN